MTFANGQRCYLEPEGNFSVVKPAFSGFDDCSSLIGFVWNSPALQPNMQWGVTIQSTHDGSVGVTQLIRGTNCCCVTGEDYRLDGSQEIYSTTSTNFSGQTYSVANPATHTLPFVSTRSCNANPAVSLTANFRDYLRFKPSGNVSNIWVTLGLTGWNMDGSASILEGLTRSNLPPAGNLIESDELPSWTDQL